MKAWRVIDPPTVEFGGLTASLKVQCSFTNGNGGACVEVMDLSDGTLVRDTKDRTCPPLHCSAPAGPAFVRAVRVGEFE